MSRACPRELKLRIGLGGRQVPINMRFSYRQPVTEGAASVLHRRCSSTRLQRTKKLNSQFLSYSFLSLSFSPSLTSSAHYVRLRDIRSRVILQQTEIYTYTCIFLPLSPDSSRVCCNLFLSWRIF